MLDRRGKDPVQVVGASAAGLFTALLLSRRGVPVEVLEGAERLDPMPRALIVTRRMRELLGPLAQDCITNQIRQFELFTDGRVASIQLHEPDLVIERAALIKSLAREGVKAGARIRFGRRFQSLQPSGSGLFARYECSENGCQEERHASVFVGGDGAASRVARQAGWPRLATAPLIQAVVPLPEDMSASTVRVWFVPQDTPYFYWLIPRDSHTGVLGLIGESGAQARAGLERFLERKSFTPVKFEAARIPIYTGWVDVERRLGAGWVFLVGDAAAQVKVTTVGGIVTGLRGALGVSERILGSRAGGELASLRRELNVHLWLRRALHHFTQADYSHLVDLLSASARETLGRYPRDGAVSVLWRLCRCEPRLVLLGLRGLIMRGIPLRHRRSARENSPVVTTTAPGD